MMHQTTIMFTMLLVNMLTNIMWLVDAGGMGQGVSYHTPDPEAEEHEELPVSCLEARTLMMGRETHLFIPECDEKGAFRDKQCWRGLEEDCWCSSPEGKRLEDVTCLLEPEPEPATRCQTLSDCLALSPAISDSEAVMALPLCLILLAICLPIVAVMTSFSWWSLVVTAKAAKYVLWLPLLFVLRNLWYISSTTISLSWRLLVLLVSIALKCFSCTLIFVCDNFVPLVFLFFFMAHQNPTLRDYLNGGDAVIYPRNFALDLVFYKLTGINPFAVY
eukprot:TRINITY_DN1243_c0_g1_i2.p1 TRINITY_DN1243_c0_g1~~TRINITY_DN1243_c0_g1_i2.p1  ORF type:complete len:296 (+),score=31.54 TRINITY_DN1243_c0_g1_i2:66-890(+)